MSRLFMQKLHIFFSSEIPEGVSFPGLKPGFFIREAMLKIEHRSVVSRQPGAVCPERAEPFPEGK